MELFIVWLTWDMEWYAVAQVVHQTEVSVPGCILVDQLLGMHCLTQGQFYVWWDGILFAVLLIISFVNTVCINDDDDNIHYLIDHDMELYCINLSDKCLFFVVYNYMGVMQIKTLPYKAPSTRQVRAKYAPSTRQVRAK